MCMQTHVPLGALDSPYAGVRFNGASWGSLTLGNGTLGDFLVAPARKNPSYEFSIT